MRNEACTGTDQEVRVYCKGAPDMLFPDTKFAVAADGSIASVDDSVEVPQGLDGAGD